MNFCDCKRNTLGHTSYCETMCTTARAVNWYQELLMTIRIRVRKQRTTTKCVLDQRGLSDPLTRTKVAENAIALKINS